MCQLWLYEGRPGLDPPCLCNGGGEGGQKGGITTLSTAISVKSPFKKGHFNLDTFIKTSPEHSLLKLRPRYVDKTQVASETDYILK